MVSEDKALPHTKKFFDFFPQPKFMKLSMEGIAVSETAVQFVEFKRGGSRGDLELVHCAGAPVPPGTIVNGVIENKEALSETLRGLRDKFHIRYVHATLPEERSYLFTVVLEKVPFEDLRDAVAFTIEDNAPVSLAESIFDYEIIGETEGKSEVKVAVTVLPTSVVEAYTAAFEDAGIVPISFDVESQAVARALVATNDDRANLIISLGSEKTGLYVAEEEVVQFSSTLPFGTKSGSDPASLRSELHKLFAFWNTRVDKQGVPGQRIQKIIFTDIGAKDEGFINALMLGIEIEHTVGDVWGNAFSRSDRRPDVPINQALGLGVAVGAALPIKEVDYI